MSVRAGGCGLHSQCCDRYGLCSTDENLFMKVAPIPCKDWSAQNNCAPRAAGETYPASCVFFADAKLVNPHIVYSECVMRYGGSDQKEALQDTHATWSITTRGRHHGDRYDRPRFGCLSLSHDVVLLRSLKDFVKDTSGSCEMPLSDFWNAPTEWHTVEKEECAGKRVVPVCQELEWDDLLLPSQRQYLDDYMDLVHKAVREGRCCQGSNVIVDLNRKAIGRPRYQLDDLIVGDGKIMTLITHQTLWNVAKSYPMPSLEQAQLHGWPVCAAHRAKFGAL